MPIEQDEETLEDDLGDGAEPSTQHMDAEPTVRRRAAALPPPQPP